MSHPNRPNRGVTLVKLLGILAVTGVLAAGVLVPLVGGVGLTGKAEADRFLGTDCTLQESTPSTKTNMYASDGTTLIAQFFAQNRVPVTLDKIPTFMQKALIDTEDRRFYDHHGVDARGLLRAAANNSESGDTQGGSTLTMQYVKQLRLYNAKTDAERAAAVVQNVDRKIQDAKCAIDLEKRESKSQILQNYFNIAFFGQNSYGVQSAAQTYFSANVDQLNLAQAAMIVGLVQAPTQYDPFSNNGQQALERRNVVIDNMVAAGDISAAEGEQTKALKLGLSTQAPPPVAMGCAYAAVPNGGFFCDYAEQWLKDHGIGEDVLLNAGLNITTTLDAGLQTTGQTAVWSGKAGTPGGAFAADSPSSLIMPSVDPRNGNVTTMITSKRYTDPNAAPGTSAPDQTSVPLFTTAAAGAGSTYKYFTTLLALASGVDPNYTLTAGAPYTTKNCPKYEDASGREVNYVVSNAGSYNATLPLTTALYQSSNTYFVGLEDMLFMCNTKPISDLAVDLGMKALTADGNTPGQQEGSFTLGQRSTSPLELASAYATVANDGVYCPPNAILSVTDQSGKPVAYTKDACTQKVAPQVARQVVSMLVNDTDTNGGTATSVFRSWYSSGGSKVASKTGTNNATANNRDNGQNAALWFVGLTPTLVSSAAIYNFSAPTSPIAGLPGFSNSYATTDAFGAAAGRYWLEAYGPTLAAQDWAWPSPNDVAGTAVPSVTGKTPSAATAILESAGFKVDIFPFTCGSRLSAGTLIGYSPKKASPGDTITACVSNGRAPTGGGSTTSTPRSGNPTNRAPAPGGPVTVGPGGGDVARPGG